MIVDDIEQIAAQLDAIENRYLASSPGSDDASIFSLTYILVLSSWIEECRDNLLLQLIDAFFVAGDHADQLKKDVRRINGFKFSEYFKRAITRIIGEHGFLELKAACDIQTMLLLESGLGYVWDVRCTTAHKTYTGLQNKSFYAPSVIKAQRDQVFAGLVELERSIHTLQRCPVR